MKNLSLDPCLVLSLVEGEHVSVDGREFVVCVMDLKDSTLDGEVYLTTVDSRVEQYNECECDATYRNWITHLRGRDDGFAVMTREKMKQILTDRTYTIE